MSQNSNLLNYGIGQKEQKEQDEKSTLVKNQPVSANWWVDIMTGLL